MLVTKNCYNWHNFKNLTQLKRPIRTNYFHFYSIHHRSLVSVGERVYVVRFCQQCVAFGQQVPEIQNTYFLSEIIHKQPYSKKGKIECITVFRSLSILQGKKIETYSLNYNFIHIESPQYKKFRISRFSFTVIQHQIGLHVVRQYCRITVMQRMV